MSEWALDDWNVQSDEKLSQPSLEFLFVGVIGNSSHGVTLIRELHC